MEAFFPCVPYYYMENYQEKGLVGVCRPSFVLYVKEGTTPC